MTWLSSFKNQGFRAKRGLKWNAQREPIGNKVCAKDSRLAWRKIPRLAWRHAWRDSKSHAKREVPGKIFETEIHAQRGLKSHVQRGIPGSQIFETEAHAQRGLKAHAQREVSGCKFLWKTLALSVA